MQKQTLNLKSLSPILSLKDMVLSSIREAMLSKNLKPGIMYTEAALSAELGISRTPVREALIHLASKGFVIYMPRKGFQIKSLTEKDIENLFELRLALEMAVIRRIISILTAESLMRIEELGLKYMRTADAGNRIETLNVDRQFHLYLANLTDNPYIIKAIEEIRDFIDLASIRSLEFESRTAEATREHQEIIDMLKVRSIEGALQKMEDHILVTKQRILSQIKIIVGGAPVNEKFAQGIGADGYAHDAGEAPKLVKGLLEKK